jgi:serine/threonine-protein kinase
MMKILQEEPPELKPEGVISPDALAAIVRRALEKDPAQRYQSARDFGRAVRDYLQMQERGGLAATVVRPRPEPLPERARTTVAPDPEPTRRSALPAPSVSPPTVVAQRPVAPASTPAGPRGEAGFRLSAYSDAGDSESSRSRAVRTSRWLLGMAVLLVVIFLATLAWYNRSAKDSAETLPAHEQTGAPASSPTGEPAQATPTQPPPAPELPYVTGTVLDPMNTPLPDASVKLLDGAGETIDSATTDDKGRFRFKPNMSAARLQFEMAGFRSYRCGLWRKNGSMPAGARRVRTVLSVGNSSEFVELARCPAR